MALQTTYKEYEITYREDSNEWYFEHKGREKSAKTLRAAKNAIDNLPPDRKKVERFDAYLIEVLGNRLSRVTVGAYVAKEGYRSAGFWVTDATGQRGKENIERLIKITPANDALLAEVNGLSDQIVELQSQRSEKLAAMERIDIPKE